MWGSCIFNASEHCVSRDASVRKRNLCMWRIYVMILVSWIKTFTFVRGVIILNHSHSLDLGCPSSIPICGRVPYYALYQSSFCWGISIPSTYALLQFQALHRGWVPLVKMARSENLSTYSIVTLMLSEVDVGRGSTLFKKLSLDA